MSIATDIISLKSQSVRRKCRGAERILLIVCSLFMMGFLSNNNDAAAQDLSGTAPKNTEGALKPIAVKINPPIDLNFKTKSEIYSLRMDAVKSVPHLAPRLYVPSDEIFGMMLDDKPWWGLFGLMYYGPGEKSIEGPSNQSRYILNPYMLVGLDLAQALGNPKNYLKPALFYPFALDLTWSGDFTSAKATFNITSFWKILKIFADPRIASQKTLDLVAYNARDFGYNYLAIDFEKSSNILYSSIAERPAQIRQFIHVGASCNYPGGCNNMSPDQPELRMNIIQMPATAVIKLWKNNPQKVEQPADLLFTIDMI